MSFGWTLRSGCGLLKTHDPIHSSLKFLQTSLIQEWKYHPHRDLTPPEEFKNVSQPPDRHRLPIYPKTPNIWSTGAMKPPRQTKELWRMLGEEKVHNEFTLDQFGIIALTGGMLKHKHFEVLRLGIGRNLKAKETFAIYRVDPPYKPITDHGFGKRMGGGKGTIDCYGTPVRAGRVVVEIGGKVIWDEVKPWLTSIANKMPFPALAMSSEMLQKYREEEARLLETNKNPISFEWLVRNNIMNCQEKLSEYDRRWFGKFVYKDRELNKKWQIVTRSKYKGGN